MTNFLIAITPVGTVGGTFPQVSNIEKKKFVF